MTHKKEPAGFIWSVLKILKEMLINSFGDDACTNKTVVSHQQFAIFFELLILLRVKTSQTL